MNYEILLTIMEHSLGFKEKALKWFDNYLEAKILQSLHW